MNIFLRWLGECVWPWVWLWTWEIGVYMWAYVQVILRFVWTPVVSCREYESCWRASLYVEFHLWACLCVIDHCFSNTCGFIVTVSKAFSCDIGVFPQDEWIWLFEVWNSCLIVLDELICRSHFPCWSWNGLKVKWNYLSVWLKEFQNKTLPKMLCTVLLF